MNQTLEEIYKTQLVSDAEGNAVNPFPTATPRETGSALHKFVTDNRLERTLEIGMAYGLSTLFLCQAHEDRGKGAHIAIDPGELKMWKGIGLLNIKKAGLEHRLRFIEQPSFAALPQLLAEGTRLDFAFIDGSHLFDFAFVDYFFVDRLVDVGGFIAFDDLWMPAVRKVISFMVTNRAYKVFPIESGAPASKRIARSARRIMQDPLDRDHAGMRWIGGNICVLRKEAKDDREWSFHKSF